MVEMGWGEERMVGKRKHEEDEEEAGFKAFLMGEIFEGFQR